MGLGVLRKFLTNCTKKKNQTFQIIVSDDSSGDDIASVVKKYQSSMNNLDYYRNESGHGFSRNILRLYKLSKTPYIWFLSDDEEVLPGAIDKILEALNKYEPVVALFNHIDIDPYGRKLTNGVPKDILYNNSKQLTDYTPFMRTCFLSNLVVEKRLSLDLVRKIHDENNIFTQLSLSILLLSDKFKLCEIATPIVSRTSNFESGEFFKFFFTDMLDAVFIIKHNFDNDKFIGWGKKEIFNAFQLYLSQKIGLFKCNGNPRIDTIKKIIRYYGIYSSFILLFPVLYYLVPASLLKFFYRFKLSRIYSDKHTRSIYNKNLNRVMKTKYTSGFSRYR
ncbi:MAG: glycosyltransferase family 2 protein [Patescibacteria group bacterium]